MTTEIKEILEALKPHSDIVKEYPLTLSIEEQKILLDYITNLQDKLKWYENIDPNKTIDKFRLEQNMKVKNLQQRIDKAIKKIEKDAELIDLEDGYNTCMAVIDILRGDE